MIKKHILLVFLTTFFSVFILAQNAEEATDSTPTKQVKRPTRDAVEDAVRAAEKAIEESVAKDEAKMLRKDRERGILHFIEEDTLHLYGESFAGLSLLDSAIQGKKVFITGENHTFTESNARLWLKMIKYLHANAGVRNIMFEYGYSYGFLVNEYLKTGDTTLFNSFNQFAYNEYSQAIKELKLFNDSLPEGEKLYFSAIDIERGVYPIPKILSYLMPKEGKPSDSISLHIQSLVSLASYNDFKLDEEDENVTSFNFSPGFQFKTNATLDLVHENFIKFESDYESYLGPNFREFKAIIYDHYLARKQWLEYEQDGAIQEYIYRENFMHNRFLEEQAAHRGNWFGQFGRCHTTQSKQNSNSCEWFEFNSLADRINNTAGGNFKDQVLSIAIIYDGDRYTSPDRKVVEEEFDKYFDDLDDNSIVLLDISQDSVLQTAYGEDFNFIFLNRYGRANESAYEMYDDYSDEDVSIKVLIGISSWNVDFSNLNSAISPLQNGDTISSVFENREIGFITKLDDIFVTGTMFGWGVPQTFTSSSNSDISYKLNHFYFKEIVGVELLKNSEVFDFIPAIGIGYARMKLKVDELNSNNQGALNGFLGEVKSNKYINPALLGDLRLGLDINIKNFTIGMIAGQNFDFSKNQWKTSGLVLDLGPKTSYRGSFVSLHAGVNF